MAILVANLEPGALAGLPALRLIQSLWAGVERLLADPTVPAQVDPQITVLPHIAAPTDPRSAAALAVANVRAWRAGQPLAGRVDRARGY